MKKHMIRGQWCIYRLRKKTTRWFHHLSIWVAFCRYRHNFDIGFALLGPMFVYISSRSSHSPPTTNSDVLFRFCCMKIISQLDSPTEINSPSTYYGWDPMFLYDASKCFPLQYLALVFLWFWCLSMICQLKIA